MVPSTTRSFVCTAPVVDMRRSYVGLAESAGELVQQDRRTARCFSSRANAATA
jgi:hypothetical protein